MENSDNGPQGPAASQPLWELLCPESRRLLDGMLDGVCVMDGERSVLFWSRGAEALTGHRAVELVGKSWGEGVLSPIDANGNRLTGDDCPLNRALKFGEPCRRRLYLLDKSGHRFAARTHFLPIRDSWGHVAGAMQVFQNVTEEERFYSRQRQFNRLVRQYVSKATFDAMEEELARDPELGRDPSAEGRFQELARQIDQAILPHKVKGDFDAVLESAAREGGMNAVSRDLTVFFLDVVSFTQLSEEHPAASVVEFLNQLFTLAAHIIRRHSGDIDKYIGDGVMAVFISAQDAVDAAREILALGLPALNRTLAAKGFPEVKIRMGMSSGSVIQGDIGSSDRKDMTVIGDVVNTASRVEAAANPGGFLISESTYSRLLRPQEFEFATEIRLRGKNRTVRLFKPKAG